jgi:hypothetical protein
VHKDKNRRNRVRSNRIVLQVLYSMNHYFVAPIWARNKPCLAGGACSLINEKCYKNVIIL